MAFSVRDHLRLRLVRRAEGASRGMVLGMPGYAGHAAEIGVIASKALEDYDVWTFDIDTGGRRLTAGDLWLDCARAIAERLMAEDAPRPRAMMGFSLGGFLGWLVDRLLVAAGRRVTPVINFDGGALHIHHADIRETLKNAIPDIASPAPARMLLLNRGMPGKFALVDGPEGDWAAAGVVAETLKIPTVDHLDVITPESVIASGPALSRFVEGGGGESAPETIDFDTAGGIAFRLLNGAMPPPEAPIRALIEADEPPRDGTVQLALLFLALTTRDRELALGFARRLSLEDPLHRAATYAQVAVLAVQGLREEARALAEAWCGIHPWDQKMRARANRPPWQPAPWLSVRRVLLGCDESLDCALQMRAFSRVFPEQDQAVPPRKP